MGSSYEGVFEDWEVAIARKLSSEFLARHSWIKGIELDDLVQECLLQWYLARHTYQQRKGASPQTYMAKVVRHRLHNILEEHLAEKRRADRMATSLEASVGEGEATLKEVIPIAGVGVEATTSLRLDLEQAMEKLTPLQRKLCTLLWQGYGVTEIGAILNRPRPTIYDEMKRIRRVFADAGLDEYLA
ncbi:MAG TPA: sigma-70 family RNA polymerase sigma factor [Dehalococcoidia bacterium]|jgi:RNA polymerase sigma-70 factor (ECF subfamily)|nr:sigma-70 family RNA polymerase sigma factor [Dehalococcoidia bacterium]